MIWTLLKHIPPVRRARDRYISWRITKATLGALVRLCERHAGGTLTDEQRAAIQIHFAHWIIAHHQDEFRTTLSATRLLYLYVQTEPWERIITGEAHGSTV